VSNPFDIKENDEHALDFALHLSRPFRSWWVWTFSVRLMLFSPNACLVIVRVSVAHIRRLAQNLMHIWRRIHREIASRLRIKGRKYQYIHPAACHFVHWLSRYASTTGITYRCFALLQLLYRWHHQSRKLWISHRKYAYKTTDKISLWSLLPLTGDELVYEIRTLTEIRCSKPVMLHNVTLPLVYLQW
jgi:hypothetical protein